MRSFSEFLNTERGRECCDPKLHARLGGAGTITTRNALMRFAHERYPDHFGPDPRKPTGKPFAREAMQQLWASYLAWAEEQAS